MRSGTAASVFGTILNEEIMMIKEHVKGKVRFQFYRKGELFYRTDSGLEFTVPIEDCGDGVFLAEDKAMLFMRYIRKQLELNEEGKAKLTLEGEGPA
jgi:hypothetical protein